MEKVFLVDQNEFLRKMFEKSLKNQGVDCYTVEDASDCLYLIEDLKPHLVIVDLDSVGSSELAFWDGLRNIKEDITLVLTGEKEEYSQYPLAGLKLGRFLQKPISPTGLKERLLGLLQ